MTPVQFKAALSEYGVALTQLQERQFAQYFKLLVTTNKNVNLTAITAEGEVYLKHFFDSVLPALAQSDLQTKSLRVCDVGAGAGFPSIPLKILFPQLDVTIVDSLNKRIKFLEQLADMLQLKGVHFYHARAEEFGAKDAATRESFDVVTARAVASLNVLAEFCLPLAKVGGRFIALKAAKTQAELSEAKYAIDVLGGRVIADREIMLPETSEIRHIVVIEKATPTPDKYPRKPGKPLKRPLVAK